MKNTLITLSIVILKAFVVFDIVKILLRIVRLFRVSVIARYSQNKEYSSSGKTF